MTDFGVEAVFLFLAGMAAAGLVAALRRAPVVAARRASAYESRSAEALAYGAIGRLFLDADREFLTEQKHIHPKMLRTLRLRRRHAMLLYLKQIRAEADVVWAHCREIARTTDDPDFGVRVLRRRLEFQALLFVLRLQCVAALVAYRPLDGATGLIQTLEGVREAIRQAAPEAASNAELQLGAG